MQELDDIALLREYVERDSGEAFAMLVARHVNKVYSVALRHTGNPHQAEEITQAVFVILARKSHHLRKGVILEGWLYQTARLTAVTFIRGEIRRARREQEARMQTLLNENESDVWTQIAPLLDTAMAGLNETDRHAIVLRFFYDQSMKEVGTALGGSENAAKMRVNRAVEKLQKFFFKRGVSSTTAIIAGAISANSVQAAPEALATSVAAVAVVKGATAGGSTSTLIKGALKLMAWSKAKTAVAAGVGILLAAGTTTITIKEVQKHKTYPWEVPKADFGVFYRMPPTIKIVPTKFTRDGDWCCDSTRGAMGIAQPLKEIIQIAYQKNKLRTVVITDLPADKYDFLAKLVGPQEALKNLAVNTNWTIELQKEITKKFGIKGGLEMRETDVLVLKPGSTGIIGFKASHTMPNGIALRPDPGNYSFHEQPVTTLTSVLEARFQTPVVDQTGLTNDYDFALQWDEPDPKQPNLESLKQALHDQLGLELVPTHMPIEMLVVDKAR
jgi:uncharacterized protein (TIGR03435 family)